jgi:Hsp70 protein
LNTVTNTSILSHCFISSKDIPWISLIKDQLNTALSGSSSQMALQSSTDNNQSNRSTDFDLDDRVGIEIKDGNIYLAAFDKRNSKSILLLNEHGHTATPMTIAFADDEVLIGESARDQVNTNAENTVRDVHRLLGIPFECATSLAKRSTLNPVIVQRNKQWLLRIPSANRYMSPAELVALVLRSLASFATTKYHHKFRLATIAMNSHDLAHERVVCSYAEAASLAGFQDIRVIHKAAGHVHNIINDHPWYLRPKLDLLFIVVDDYDNHHTETSLVTLNGRTIGVESWIGTTLRNFEAACDRVVELMPQTSQTSNRRQLVGLVVNISIHLTLHQSSIVSNSMDKIHHLCSTKLYMQNIEYQGPACRGIIFGGNDRDTDYTIIEKSSYFVEMAIASSYTSPEKFSQLIRPGAVLPCEVLKSLTLASAKQDGVLLRFFAKETANPSVENGHLLAEVAIRLRENENDGTLKPSACMKPGLSLHFSLFTSTGRCLASVDYSNDGLVSIKPAHIPAITQPMRRKWLPRTVTSVSPDSPPAANGEGTRSCSTTNKRARHS